MLEYVLPSVMNFQLIRIIVAILCTGFFSYLDIFNNRNIPDKYLYIFLGISSLFLIIDSTTLFPSLIWAILIGSLGYLFYRSGQLGGADVIYFVSICFLLPMFPSIYTNELSQMPFILSLIIFSGLFLLLFIIFKYLPKLVADTIRGKIKISVDKWLYSLGLIFMFSIVSFMLSQIGVGNPIPCLLLFAYIIFATVFFNLYKDELVKLMSEELDLTKVADRKKVEAEDVVAIDLMDKKYVEKYKIPRLLSQKELDRLIKAKVKLTVSTNLPPFIPFVFLALLLLIFVGDLLYHIISTMFFSF